jgi:hypothetical protein
MERADWRDERLPVQSGEPWPQNKAKLGTEMAEGSFSPGWTVQEKRGNFPVDKFREEGAKVNRWVGH